MDEGGRRGAGKRRKQTRSLNGSSTANGDGQTEGLTGSMGKGKQESRREVREDYAEDGRKVTRVGRIEHVESITSCGQVRHR